MNDALKEQISNVLATIVASFLQLCGIFAIYKACSAWYADDYAVLLVYSMATWALYYFFAVFQLITTYPTFDITWRATLVVVAFLLGIFFSNKSSVPGLSTIIIAELVILFIAICSIHRYRMIYPEDK